MHVRTALLTKWPGILLCLAALIGVAACRSDAPAQPRRPRPSPPATTMTAAQAESAAQAVARDYEYGLRVGTLKASLRDKGDRQGPVNCGTEDDDGWPGQVRIRHQYVVTPIVRGDTVRSVLDESASGYSQM